MITEVYVNDLLINIDDDTTIAASYGNISFGELSKRKGVKSTVLTAPFSPKNKLVFESCEVAGSNSVVPYRKNSFRVDIYGVTVFSGFCIMSEAKESYQIQSFAGASDFYSIIGSKKLAELDLSEWEHIWDESVMSASWTNTTGYIYAFVYNGKYQAIDKMAPDGLSPHIFFHTLIKQIAIDAGYTLVGDVLNSTRFLKHIVLCNKFPLPIQYGGTFDLSLLLPDLAQSKLWLDFANIYGLQFDIDNDNKIVRANYIDDILLNNPENWTTKVDKSEKPRKRYSLGYGQKSYLRYQSDDVAVLDYAKEVLIDDETLETEVDIYKSPFFLLQNDGNSGNAMTYDTKSEESFAGAWDAATPYTSVTVVKVSVWWNGTYYRAIADSTGQEPPNATYWKVIKEKDIFDIKNRPMYGYLETIPTSPARVLFNSGYVPVTKVLTYNQLDWGTTYQNHYSVFDRIVTRTKVVENLIKLNHSDVNQLDFTKAKRIDNELYIVEEVRQFKMNKKDSTIVNMIRL